MESQRKGRGKTFGLERMELPFPEMGLIAGGASLEGNWKRPDLTYLSLGCLLDISSGTTEYVLGICLEFTAAFWAGDTDMEQHRHCLGLRD